MSHHPNAAAQRVALLLSPAFVLAVATLAVNDHLLKPAFGNGLTGKLSDVAGLFAFALFWCALAPGRRTAVCLTTAVAWMTWKSPLADAPIAAWNALGLVPVARVMDGSDWLAILMLPAAWWRAGRVADSRARHHAWQHAWRRVGAVASAMAAVLAFGATSVPQQHHATYYHDEPSWTIAASRPQLRGELETHGFFVTAEYPRRIADDTAKVTGVIEFRLGRAIGGDPVIVSVRLDRVAGDTTRVRLIGARTLGGTGRPREDAVLMLFEDTVIAPLRARFAVVER